MTRTIYNKDFKLSQKVKLLTFYVKGYKWFSFNASIKSFPYHICYNLQISKFALSLLVKKD